MVNVPLCDVSDFSAPSESSSRGQRSDLCVCTLSLSTVFCEVLDAMEMVSGWLLPSPWLSASSPVSLQPNIQIKVPIRHVPKAENFIGRAWQITPKFKQIITFVRYNLSLFLLENRWARWQHNILKWQCNSDCVKWMRVNSMNETSQ